MYALIITRCKNYKICGKKKKKEMRLFFLTRISLNDKLEF